MLMVFSPAAGAAGVAGLEGAGAAGVDAVFPPISLALTSGFYSVGLTLPIARSTLISPALPKPKSAFTS